MSALVRFVDAGLEGLDSVLDRFHRRQGVIGALLLSPSLLILGVFAFFPLLYAIYISLFDTRRGVFNGAGNYVRAFGEPEFSVKVTFYYAIGTVPLSLAIGFAIRVAAVSDCVCAQLLSYAVLPALRNLCRGVRNSLARAAASAKRFDQSCPLRFRIRNAEVAHRTARGIAHSHRWVCPATIGPSLALCCILFDIWHASGFMIVVFLAGLSSIPPQLEEGARLDGASTWQVVRHVSLPLLSPTIFFLLIVSAISRFNRSTASTRSSAPPAMTRKA